MDMIEMPDAVEPEPASIPEDHPIRTSDRYGPGARLLRRWSLNDDGRPVCALDALDTLAATAEQIAEADAANAAVRAALDVPEPEALASQPPSLEAYRLAVMAHVDATATQRGYDNAVSCAGYVNSTVLAWAAEAAAFVAWRDAVWIAVFDRMAEVQGGAPAPSIYGLIAGLPAIEWPA